MTGRIKNILFVCTGNICRSPFAEAYCRKLVQEKGLVGVEVESAGIMALPGNQATLLAQKAALEHHVDLTGHRAKLVTRELAARSDLILVMEKSHERDLLENFPETEGNILLLRYFARSGSRNRGISDPYGLNVEAYRFCFLDMEEALWGLVAYLQSTTQIFTPLQVVCYEGYKENESPRFFDWEEKRHTVTDIVDRWYQGSMDSQGEMADYFKVRNEDGDIFILRYDRQRHVWGILAP